MFFSSLSLRRVQDPYDNSQGAHSPSYNLDVFDCWIFFALWVMTDQFSYVKYLRDDWWRNWQDKYWLPIKKKQIERARYFFLLLLVKLSNATHTWSFLIHRRPWSVSHDTSFLIWYAREIWISPCRPTRKTLSAAWRSRVPAAIHYRIHWHKTRTIVISERLTVKGHVPYDEIDIHKSSPIIQISVAELNLRSRFSATKKSTERLLHDCWWIHDAHQI